MTGIKALPLSWPLPQILNFFIVMITFVMSLQISIYLFNTHFKHNFYFNKISFI